MARRHLRTLPAEQPLEPAVAKHGVRRGRTVGGTLERRREITQRDPLLLFRPLDGIGDPRELRRQPLACGDQCEAVGVEARARRRLKIAELLAVDVSGHHRQSRLRRSQAYVAYDAAVQNAVLSVKNALTDCVSFRQLVEQPVSEVQAFVDNMDTPADINGTVNIRFANGILANAAALVLVPTRELATQVAAELRPAADALGVRIAAVFGGASIASQAQQAAAATATFAALPPRRRLI